MRSAADRIAADQRRLSVGIAAPRLAVHGVNRATDPRRYRGQAAARRHASTSASTMAHTPGTRHCTASRHGRGVGSHVFVHRKRTQAIWRRMCVLARARMRFCLCVQVCARENLLSLCPPPSTSTGIRTHTHAHAYDVQVNRAAKIDSNYRSSMWADLDQRRVRSSIATECHPSLSVFSSPAGPCLRSCACGHGSACGSAVASARMAAACRRWPSSMRAYHAMLVRLCVWRAAHGDCRPECADREAGRAARHSHTRQ